MRFKRLLAPACVAAALTIPMATTVPAAQGLKANQLSGSVAMWERFSGHDPESRTVLNHDVFSTFLDATVLDVGRSKSRLGYEKPKTYKESHIVYTSGKPSRFEGNRIFFHEFKDAHLDYLLSYQEGLEGFSAQRSLSSLNRDEQLAFWLNLYNTTVLIKLCEEYPVKTLKSLRLGSSKAASFWEEKTVRVEGVDISLVDIEGILFANWDNPLVMYGLFQGSIGGPSLMTEAFSGANVWQNLQKNAVEFVNSNRGVRSSGSKAEVSAIYDWWAAAYGGSDDALIGHILSLADQFHGDLSTLQRVKKKYYDWNIADMMGGTRHTGRHNQMGGVVNTGSPNGVQADEAIDVRALAFDVMRFDDRSSGSLPPAVMELLTNIMKHNDVPRRVPTVTVQECGSDVECYPENSDR